MAIATYTIGWLSFNGEPWVEGKVTLKVGRRRSATATLADGSVVVLDDPCPNTGCNGGWSDVDGRVPCDDRAHAVDRVHDVGRCICGHLPGEHNTAPNGECWACASLGEVCEKLTLVRE